MRKKIYYPLLTLTLLAFPFRAWAYPSSSQNGPSDEITPSVGPIPTHTVDCIFDAEFLWWYSSMTDFSYAIKGETIGTGSPNVNTSVWAPKEKQEFNWEWDPGLRVGLGVVTNHDGWDVYSEWTYFYNSLSTSSSVPPFNDSNLGPFTSVPLGIEAFTSAWFLTPNGNYFSGIQSKYALLFNQIDLQLGRNYWISRFLSLRPFVGVRGYWGRLHFSVHGNRPLRADSTFFETGSTYKQKSWAVGILTGLNTAWHFTSDWSLFGHVAVALPYGKYWIRRKSFEFQIDQNDAVVGNISVTTRDTITQTQPFIDLTLGIRWETTFNECCRLLFDIGWENHCLVDFNQLFRGTEPTISQADYPSTNGNLTLSGITARGRIEF